MTCTVGVHAAAASAVTITEFSSGLNPGSIPSVLVRGEDGTMWFTDDGSTPAIGKITPSGTITEYSTGLNPGSLPLEIVRGEGGNLWFTDIGGNLVGTSAIGKITPAGVITEYTAGLKFCGGLPGVAGETAPGPEDLAAGAGGKIIWFTDTGSPAIGKVSPSGAITEYCTSENTDSPAELANAPFSITVGPNEDAWFTRPGRRSAR